MEVPWPVGFTNSLEHFDGNDLVELPGAVAVVLKPDLRLVGKTGLRQAGKVQIVEGLSVGETIVTDGQMKLRPGADAVVVEP